MYGLGEIPAVLPFGSPAAAAVCRASQSAGRQEGSQPARWNGLVGWSWLKWWLALSIVEMWQLGVWSAVPVALNPCPAYNAPPTAELESGNRHVLVITLEKSGFCKGLKREGSAQELRTWFSLGNNWDPLILTNHHAGFGGFLLPPYLMWPCKNHLLSSWHGFCRVCLIYWRSSCFF